MKNTKPPKIICHRGASHELPENTLEAVHAGIVLPVYGVEFDVDLTKDGIPLLIHQETAVPNETFDRLELGCRDEGRSWTHNYTWDEIKHFDVGTWKSSRSSHMRFTRLEEVLNLNWGAKLAVIELKNPYFYKGKNRDFAERIVKIALPIIAGFISKGGNAQLLSFDTDIIEIIRPQLPNNEVVLAIDPCFPEDASTSVKLAHQLGVDSLIVMDQWLIKNQQWFDFSNKFEKNLWAFELTPDAGSSATRDITEIQKLNWIELHNLNIVGFHSDRASDCYRFYKNLNLENIQSGSLTE